MSLRVRLCLSSVPTAPVHPVNFVLETQQGRRLSFETKILPWAVIDILNTCTVGEQCRRAFQKGGARERQGSCQWNSVEKGQESSEVMQINDTICDYQPKKCDVNHNLPRVYNFAAYGTAIATLGAHAGFPIGSISVR